jgi:threonine/homoserine/homoserine lactone efflux protein
MSPSTALVAGVVAGLAVAMPLGAIGLLILDAGIRRGLRPGIAAGAGVAAADLTYAVVAAVAAGPIAVALAPHARMLHLVAGVVLVVVAVKIALGVRRPAGTADGGAAAGLAGTAARFYGLTLINPLTATAFAAVVLAMPGGEVTALGVAAFAVGAFAASLAWQSVLAMAGAVAGSRLSDTARTVTTLAGAALVAALALRAVVTG